MGAFAFEHPADSSRKTDEVWMAIHVDDIVEIAWAATLSQCSELLTEEFGDGVARDPTHRQRVAVRVPDGAKHGTAHEDLVGGEIDLHLWERGVAVRPSVGDPALRCWMIPLVLLPLERLVVKHELDARLLSGPLSHLAEDRHEVAWLLWPAIDDGEIKILREPEGLVVALTKACPALEHPGA